MMFFGLTAVTVYPQITIVFQRNLQKMEGIPLTTTGYCIYCNFIRNLIGPEEGQKSPCTVIAEKKLVR